MFIGVEKLFLSFILTSAFLFYSELIFFLEFSDHAYYYYLNFLSFWDTFHHRFHDRIASFMNEKVHVMLTHSEHTEIKTKLYYLLLTLLLFNQGYIILLFITLLSIALCKYRLKR